MEVAASTPQVTAETIVLTTSDPESEPALTHPVTTETPVPTPDLAMHSAALEAFAAALPQLRQIGEPRLSEDQRSLQWLRRAAQRAMFRALRPYWFQQRQFQDAFMEAVHASLKRLAAPGAAPPAAPPTQIEHLGPGA